MKQMEAALSLFAVASVSLGTLITRHLLRQRDQYATALTAERRYSARLEAALDRKNRELASEPTEFRLLSFPEPMDTPVADECEHYLTMLRGGRG